MPAIDPFVATNITPVTAARHAESVSPNDTNDLSHVTSSIYIGGTGDLTVVMADGSQATFKAVPVGTMLQLQARRVMATGTTATLIVALWS